MPPLRRELKIEMRGRDVRLLQEALKSAGFAPEDPEGEFGRSTAFALRAFQAEHNLPVSGMLDERTLARLGEVLGRDPFGPRPDEPPAGRGLVVRGRVTQADGTPIAGARVQAVEKALLGRADRPLGQTQSDAAGLYEIRVPRVDADGVDLLVQVLAPDSEDVITRSPLILGAEGERTVDLIVSSPLYPPPSEFDQIARQLDPLLAEVDLNALDRDSLALLAGKTGLSPLRVTHYVQARRFAAQGRVPPEVYYGLFRANLPVNKPALVAQDNALLAEALTTASRAGAIDPALAEKPEAVAKLVARLNTEAIDDLIKQPALSDGTPSLGAFVSLAGLSDNQQRAFVQLVQTHDAPGREFWKRLEADPAFDEQAVRSVRLAAQLGTLTFNNAPLMADLHQRLRDAESAGDPLRGLVGLDQRDWLRMIEEATGPDGRPVIPAGIPVSGEEKPAEAYARTMARVIEDTYPTATIAARLDEEDFEGAAQVRAFLDRAPDYEIRETSVRRYAQTHEVEIDPAEQAAVERVQRVFALAPRFERYDSMRPLLAKGVDSAYAIKTMGERRFMQTFGETMGEAEAHVVYSNAAQKTALTTALFAKYGAQFNNLPMAVLPGMNIPGVLGEIGNILGPELAMDFATWEGLFGSTDFCACEHCRSVFSPAAYLVALLKFLRDRGALDELAARRADIGNVELNCHNTHTTLPYVDLVSEVLEGFIAGAADIHQTEGEASDLRVHPEHINADAYTELESRVYPWVLPFGLWTEEARAYLQPLDVTRHAIMDRFNPALPEDRNVAAWLPIAIERLGLLEAERDILLDGAFHTSHWNSVPLNSLRTVRTLLDTARISFLELRQMIGTRFVNGDGALVIDYVVGEGEEAELTCDLTEARIEALTTGHLNRIERFIRLRRKLGWSVYELDVVLTALGGALNAQTLVNLSFIHALRERLEVDLPVIASWVAGLDTRPYLGDDDEQHPSYYAALFLNRTVGGADEVAPFEPESLGGAAIDDHEAAILAALQIITAEELALIRERRLADGALSLANLSEMHRVATFKRALKISVRDLLDLLDLTGLNPFSAASLYDALRVIDVLDTIEAAGFTLPELGYLLRHEFDANRRVAPSEAQIAVFLTQLRAGLQRIHASFQAAPDPGGEITSRLLGAVVAPDDLLPALALLYGVAPASELPADPAAFLDARFAPFIPDATARADVIARLVDDTDPGYLQPEVEQAARFALVLEPLAAYLRGINSVALVQQMAADFLEIELGASDLLLGGLIRSVADAAQPASAIFLADAFLDSTDAITAAAFPDAFAMLYRLHKTALLITRLAIPTDELAWIVSSRAQFGWLDFNALPVAPNGGAALFDPWLRLARLFILGQELPSGAPSLFDLLRQADAGGNAAAFEAFLTALAGRTRWNRADLDTLIDAAHFDLDDFDADWSGASALDHLMRLHAAFRVLRRLGVPAAMAWGWTAQPVTRAMAAEVKQAARAKYSATQWLSVAEPIRDGLRERQRQALVEAAIQQLDDPAIRDTNDLYAHFLMDVEMAPCMLTSRLVFATGAVQLFIQRVFLNLEDGVSFSTEDAAQWAWMKNYRVWEANVKVFITPENWIEPELRPEKSVFFAELEGELLQNDITLETAELAYQGYLEKLDEVARLEVVGAYNENDTGTLHVVARTKGAPQKYYYRRWFEGRRWTPWQPIPLDIEAPIVTPVVYNRRLYLFWFITQVLAEESVPGDDGHAPDRYLEIKLAWSQFRQRKWTPKRMSDVVVQSTRTRSASSEMLRPEAWRPRPIIQPNGDLMIAVERSYASGGGETYLNSATIQSGSPNGFLFVNDGQVERGVRDFAALPIPVYNGGSWSYFYASSPTANFSESGLRLRGLNQSWQNVLKTVPHPFRVTTPLQYTDYNSSAPLFFEDKHRTYFIVPEHQYGKLPPYLGDYAIDVNPQVFLEMDKPIPFEDLVWGSLIGGRIPVPRPPDGDPVYVPSQPGDGLINVLPQLGDGLIAPETIADTLGRAGTLVDPGSVLNVVTTPGAVLGGNVRVPYEQIDLGSLTQTTAGISGAMPGLVSGSFGGVMDQPLLAMRSMPLLRADASTQTRALSGASAAGVAIQAADLAFANASWEMAVNPAIWGWGNVYKRTVYTFYGFYHPYVPFLIKQLNRYGVEGLLNPREHGEAHALRRQLLREPSNQEFDDLYTLDSAINDDDLPVEEFDFEYGTPYSIYNWELFFHIPFIIANKLSQNRRFEEAQKWYHFIFDPTDNSDVAPEMNRYRFWKIKPFFLNTDIQTIEQLLRLLSSNDPADQKLRKQLEDQVKDWRRNPFQPHLIAEQRVIAYQKAIVMKYLDNLIAWGDTLFRQDTRESVNEATQIYILAAEILGKQPEKVPAPEGDPTIGGQPVRTFNDLAPHLDALDNALVRLESELTGTTGLGAADALTLGGDGAAPDEAPVHEIAGSTLFFCIPPNEKLLGYWDTVADRLFKIRHCMNIEGVERQLALFAPPIDPALLVRAAAAGIDLSSVLTDLNAPRPHYRFNTMLQKAVELTGEVRSLGAALLAALEKRDAEKLALLRQSHAEDLLKATRTVRKRQIDEAKEAIAGLTFSLQSAQERQRFYANRKPLIPNEKLHLNKMEAATVFDTLSQGSSLVASVLAIIPDFDLGAEGGFSSPVVKASFGGTNLSRVANIMSQIHGMMATLERASAQRASTLASYDRRQEEWNFSRDQARIESKSLERQLEAARIRLAIAEQELANQELQIEQSDEIDEFMRDKFTNQDLYNWMITQLSTIYFQCYQLAYDLAQRAEKAYQHELADYSATFIQFGYWDSLKKGLLAGDRLYYDLRRMEAAYLDSHKRELELTRTISLAQIDPAALIQLRETGSCEFETPEALFNLDYPSHYLRRIKSLSVTIPCVAGPYTSVSATLTLLGNRIRVSTVDPQDPYTGADDARFITNIGGIQAIATSTGRNDAGLFELSYNDPRYLPFEGVGAIGRWRLEMNAAYRAFDYSTISDVLLHVRYTARDGGRAVRDLVVPELADRVNEIANLTAHTGLYHFISFKREQRTALHQLLHPAGAEDHATTLTLARDHFPYIFQGQTLDIDRAVLLLRLRDAALYDDGQPLAVEITRGDGAAGSQDLLTAGAAFGGLPHAEYTHLSGEIETTEDWTLHITPEAVAALPAALRQTVTIEGANIARLRADRIEDIGLLIHYTVD